MTIIQGQLKEHKERWIQRKFSRSTEVALSDQDRYLNYSVFKCCQTNNYRDKQRWSKSSGTDRGPPLCLKGQRGKTNHCSKLTCDIEKRRKRKRFHSATNFEKLRKIMFTWLKHRIISLPITSIRQRLISACTFPRIPYLLKPLIALCRFVQDSFSKEIFLFNFLKPWKVYYQKFERNVWYCLLLFFLQYHMVKDGAAFTKDNSWEHFQSTGHKTSPE